MQVTLLALLLGLENDQQIYLKKEWNYLAHWLSDTILAIAEGQEDNGYYNGYYKYPTSNQPTKASFTSSDEPEQECSVSNTT